jgi:hypothetical protein
LSNIRLLDFKIELRTKATFALRTEDGAPRVSARCNSHPPTHPSRLWAIPLIERIDDLNKASGVVCREISRPGKTKASNNLLAFELGARSWTRTNDPLINSQVL